MISPRIFLNKQSLCCSLCTANPNTVTLHGYQMLMQVDTLHFVRKPPAYKLSCSDDLITAVFPVDVVTKCYILFPLTPNISTKHSVLCSLRFENLTKCFFLALFFHRLIKLLNPLLHETSEALYKDIWVIDGEFETGRDIFRGQRSNHLIYLRQLYPNQIPSL